MNTDDDWPKALSYWRSFAADSFDDALRAEVVAWVASVHASSSEWRDAAAGDAAAAARLVDQLKTPAQIELLTDMAMTLLLHIAFENAEAALALAEALLRMPLARGERARLSTSWRLHKIWLESDRRKQR